MAGGRGQTAYSDDNILSLKGVGPRIAERLQKLGIERVQDILFHLPRRYQDRTSIRPIGSLRPGDTAVVEAEIELTEITFGRRRMLLSRISDGTGALTLRFFNFSNAQKDNLARGRRIRCFGEVRFGKSTPEMAHPEYQLLNGNESLPEADSLTPVYPTTEGLHQLKMRDLTGQVLDRLRNGRIELEELLPEAVREQFGLSSLRESIEYIHRPPVDADVHELAEGRHPAQRRLAFEELLAHHLSLRQLRQRMQQDSAPELQQGAGLMQQLQQQLPFELTGAQLRVIEEIRRDLATGTPMLRLVQGDVGSGKTLVAVAASLEAIASGYQAALMAPTELLAEQHLHNFARWLQPLGITVAWLSGRSKGKAREAMLAAIGSGEAQMIIGTHALFQQDVEFGRLGLVIIDEQHRFGVHQRLSLREKGKTDQHVPHQLIMTATPIPRTLAMTAYADLDVSVIDELPPGRKPVTTVIIPEVRREEVVERVYNACQSGRQAYWVCTLIEESEVLQCQAAEDTAAYLQDALNGIRVGLVHGRMKPSEKESVMQAFKNADIDLLVATTVIEVGVDVPNASLMIIENAERLGLAQLHQLRGRVGRGDIDSSCVLMYAGKLSANARSRLDIMRETNDGFRIAQKDLEIRGPGEVLGTRQTGMLQLQVADLERDSELVPDIHLVAEQLLAQAPELVPRLVQRWLGILARYGDV